MVRVLIRGVISQRAEILPLIQWLSWSVLCTSECVTTPISTARRLFWIPAVRRTVEYTVTVGIALLCSQWILQARWY